MDTDTAAVALGISGLVTVLVAFTKGLWPGEMPGRAVMATVALWTAVLMALAVQSGELDGSAFSLVAQAILQAAAAIGFREGVVNVPKVGATLTSLPSRGTGSG